MFLTIYSGLKIYADNINILSKKTKKDLFPQN